MYKKYVLLFTSIIGISMYGGQPGGNLGQHGGRQRSVAQAASSRPSEELLVKHGAWSNEDIGLRSYLWTGFAADDSLINESVPSSRLSSSDLGVVFDYLERSTNAKADAKLLLQRIVDGVSAGRLSVDEGISQFRDLFHKKPRGSQFDGVVLALRNALDSMARSHLQSSVESLDRRPISYDALSQNKRTLFQRLRLSLDRMLGDIDRKRNPRMAAMSELVIKVEAVIDYVRSLFFEHGITLSDDPELSAILNEFRLKAYGEDFAAAHSLFATIRTYIMKQYPMFDKSYIAIMTDMYNMPLDR